MIQDFLKDKDWSRNDLADALAKRYEPKRPDKKRAPRSLVAEIRKLEGGNTTWFDTRPGAADQLAAILGVTATELGIKGGETRHSFIDCPGAPPLDLMTHAPFGIEGWLPLLDHAAERPTWFSGPTGSGKTLFARWAAVRGLVTRVEVASLVEIEKLPNTHRTLVVDLSRTEAESIGAVSRLSALCANGGARLLVLASTPRPGGPGDRQATAWSDFEWNVRTWDRHAFVAWFGGRWSDDRKLGAELDRRLRKFDPEGALIATPGDLVQFLGAAYESRRVANLDVGDALIRRAATGIDSVWFKTHARELFRRLALARWADVHHAYVAPVPRADWQRYVPERLAAPGTRAALLTELERLKKDAKSDAGEIADRLAHDAATSVRLLEEAKLLSAQSVDSLSLRPQWVAHADVLVALKQRLTRGQLDIFMEALDGTRRRILDEVVDALDDGAFDRLLKTVVEHQRDAGLRRVAAVEAMFAAVARRHDASRNFRRGPELERLARLQLELRVERHLHALAGPVTRPGAGYVGGVGFVADCWSWSLLIPRPPAIDVESWLFPGWISEMPADEPWLAGLAAVGSGDARSRLERTLKTLLTRWTPTRRSSIVKWMLPQLVSTEADWEIPPASAEVLGEESVALAIRNTVGQLGADRRAASTRRLWRLLSGVSFDRLIQILAGPLGPLLMAEVEAASEAAEFGNWARGARRDLGRVPQQLRGPLVRWLLDHDPGVVEDLWSQPEYLEPEDADVLIRLANLESMSGASFAIQRLWTVAPHAAVAEFEMQLRSSDDLAARWIDAPAGATDMILEVVERNPLVKPAWMRRWAARRILDAPWLADRLWKIAQ